MSSVRGTNVGFVWILSSVITSNLKLFFSFFPILPFSCLVKWDAWMWMRFTLCLCVSIGWFVVLKKKSKMVVLVATKKQSYPGTLSSVNRYPSNRECKLPGLFRVRISLNWAFNHQLTLSEGFDEKQFSQILVEMICVV